MLNWDQLGARPPDLLLPVRDFDAWAVVACDQFTSQPEYWRETERLAGDKPSAFKLIYPEAFLEEGEGPIGRIHQTMEQYLAQGTLRPLEQGSVLVERFLSHATRQGLLLALDLENYDYSPQSASLIRPTEGTIAERIPARLKVRQGAALDLPHVMLLLDDPACTVIEPLLEKKLDTLYDFELMQGGGRIRGGFVPLSALEGVRAALCALLEKQSGSPLLYAVGDGNHSLAAARANWENLKAGLSGEERKSHPARFALAELTNIHSPGINFEPIHRALFNCAPPQQVLSALESIIMEQNPGSVAVTVTGKKAGLKALVEGGHAIEVAKEGLPPCFLCIKPPCDPMAMVVLQRALDEYLSLNPLCRIDYIHGEEALRGLCGEALGFILPPVDKGVFFKQVQKGPLPRKTFSMGQAWEKRYYIEARKLTV